MKFLVSIILLAALGAGGYYLYQNYLSPQVRLTKNWSIFEAAKFNFKHPKEWAVKDVGQDQNQQIVALNIPGVTNQGGFIVSTPDTNYNNQLSLEKNPHE